jgi:type IV pilus assembly protein PilB
MDSSSSPEERLGTDAIVSLLCEEGVVGEQQIAFARRVQARLATKKPLLGVLEELEYVTKAQIRAALQKRRLDVRLGDLLMELGVLDPRDLRMALELQRQDPRAPKLGQVLVEHRFVDEQSLTELLASQLGFELVEPRLADIDRGLLARANRGWMLQNEFIPVRMEGRSVVVAFADPMNAAHVEAARAVFGGGIQLAIAPRSAVLQALARLDPKAQAAALASIADESQVVETVRQILDEAIEAGASDVHIEPLSDRLRIRFRQDGVLVQYREFPREIMRALSNRIKVMCEADLAERRRHQDARLFYRSGEREFDLRVSIYVTIHGEKIVMRLLSRSRKVASLREIGMAPYVLERFLLDALERPSGVILITGPTGSGKTSTLYSCIHHIVDSETSIITAEDPVEYVIDGIGQCSVDPSIDRGFDATLKQIVRQDPDVIVIGEIRDTFSADTAIQAALTGHKVLTTFHTEDSIGGLVRLLNMDIEAFLVSSTVVSVLAQRLVRRVCDGCAAPYRPTPADLQRLGYAGDELAGHELRIGRGCPACRHSGYRGRAPIFELLVMDPGLRDAILNRRTAYEIRSLARETGGMLSLLEDGIEKAARGITTVREIVRMLPRLDKPRPLHELRRLSGWES